EGRMGEVIKLITRARASGQEVLTDQYPYDGAAVALLADLIIVPENAPPPAGTDMTPPSILARAKEALRDQTKLAAIRAASEHGVNGDSVGSRRSATGACVLSTRRSFPTW